VEIVERAAENENAKDFSSSLTPRYILLTGNFLFFRKKKS